MLSQTINFKDADHFESSILYKNMPYLKLSLTGEKTKPKKHTNYPCMFELKKSLIACVILFIYSFLLISMKGPYNYGGHSIRHGEESDNVS